MKRYILILTLLFISKLSISQNYIPLPMDSSAWRVEWGCSFCNVCLLEYAYKTDGDTVINSISYTKIIKNIIGGSCCWDCPTGNTGYQGAIRQDTLGKKIFIIEPFSTNENIVYDFNLSVGDTVNSTLIFCGPEIVTAVDSVLIGNIYHRRLILSSNCNWFPIELIEGIGSNKGLLEPFVGFEYGGTLICATYNNQTIYPDTTTICPTIIGINEPVQINEIKVSPNPFKDKFEIDFYKNFPNILFNLYDTFGRNILVKGFSDVSTITIKAENLSSGIYFYQILSENKIISSGKVIAE